MTSKSSLKDAQDSELLVWGYVRSRSIPHITTVLKGQIRLYWHIPLQLSIFWQWRRCRQQYLNIEQFTLDGQEIMKRLKATEIPIDEPVFKKYYGPHTIPLVAVSIKEESQEQQNTMSNTYLFKTVVCFVRTLADAERIWKLFDTDKWLVVMFTDSAELYSCRYLGLVKPWGLKLHFCTHANRTDVISTYIEKNLWQSAMNFVSFNNMTNCVSMVDIQKTRQRIERRSILEERLVSCGCTEKCSEILAYKFGSIQNLEACYEKQNMQGKIHQQQMMVYNLGQECSNADWLSAWGNLCIKYSMRLLCCEPGEKADEHNRPTKESSLKIWKEFAFDCTRILRK